MKSKMHPEFEERLRSTGRIASSEPALQNIPLRTEKGKAIREAFLPKDGQVFVDIGHAEIEFRIWAELYPDLSQARKNKE